MGCSISTATAGVVEATKSDATTGFIAAEPVNGRPLEPRDLERRVRATRTAPVPERVCLYHAGVAVSWPRGLHEPPASYHRCRGLVAMQRSLRPHGSLRPREYGIFPYVFQSVWWLHVVDS